MTIYECKPGNMPEDIILDFNEKIPFVTGDNEESVKQEFNLKIGTFSYRKHTNRGYSWCGNHPLYWRKLNENEERIFIKFINNLKRRK